MVASDVSDGEFYWLLLEKENTVYMDNKGHEMSSYLKSSNRQKQQPLS